MSKPEPLYRVNSRPRSSTVTGLWRDLTNGSSSCSPFVQLSCSPRVIMALTPPRSPSRPAWPLPSIVSGSFGNESRADSVDRADTFTGLEDFVGDDEPLGTTTPSAVSMTDSMARRRLRVRTTSIPRARIDISALNQVRRHNSSLEQEPIVVGSSMRYSSNGMMFAPSNVLQIEIYTRQWNFRLPSTSAIVQFLVVVACLMSQLLLFGDIPYQLLMLAISIAGQALVLFLLHCGLHLRQKAASGYYSTLGLGREQEHLGRSQAQAWQTPTRQGQEPPKSRAQLYNSFYDKSAQSDSFRAFDGNAWQRAWGEIMSLIRSGDFRGLLHALVESKAFLLQRLLITVFWCALYVHFTKYLYRDEVCDHDSYETTFIHKLLGYGWRCKWLTDRIPDWHVPMERVFLWVVNLDFCVSLITAREKFKWLKRLSTILDIFTMPLFMLVVRWALAIDPEDYLSLYGYTRFMRLYGLHRTLERIATSTSEITLKIISISLGVLGIIFTFSGAMFNEEAPAGLKGEFTAFFDYVYFFVVTLSTVGYGDFAPVTGFGRMLCINAIGIVVIFIPAQIRELNTLIRQPRGQIGVIPSRKTLGVDGKFVLVLTGKLSADELDTFIWELAHSHALYCHNVVVFTTSPMKDFEEAVAEALSKFGIRICMKAGDTASGVSQDLCKLRWGMVGAVIVLSDRRCGSCEVATPLSCEQVCEDHRSVVRCLHVRKFWDQGFGLSCHLLREDASRQILDMGAEQVTSRHDLMLRIMAKTCSGCPGFSTLFCNMFKSLALPAGAPPHKMLSEFPWVRKWQQYQARIRSGSSAEIPQSPLFPGFKEYLNGAMMCVYRITCPPFVATATSPYKFEELLLLFADHSRVCVFGTERMTSTGHMLLNPSGQEISAEDVLIILASSARRALEIQAMTLPPWSDLDRDRMELFIPSRSRRRPLDDDILATQNSLPSKIPAAGIDEDHMRSPERHHTDTTISRGDFRHTLSGDTRSIPGDSNGGLRCTNREGVIVFPIPGRPESVSRRISEDDTEGSTKKKRSSSAGAVLTRDMSDKLADLGLIDGQNGGPDRANKAGSLRRQKTFAATGRRAINAFKSMGSIFALSPHSSSGTGTRRPSHVDGDVSPSRRFRSSIVKRRKDGLESSFPSRASLRATTMQGAESRCSFIERRKSLVNGATRLRLQPVFKVDESRIVFEDFLGAFPELAATIESRLRNEPARRSSLFDPTEVLGFTVSGPSLVVVVGWPNGLSSFLRTMFNSKGGAMTKCVILSPSGGGSIAELAEFTGKVAWVVGSPTSREDLARAGVGAADVVAVLTSLASSPGVVQGSSKQSHHGSSTQKPPLYQDFTSILTAHEIKHVKDKVRTPARCYSMEFGSSLSGGERRFSVASMFSEDGAKRVRVSRSTITCLHDVTSLPFLDESSWWPSGGVKSNLFHVDSPEYAMGNVISESMIFPAICRSPVLSDILVDAGMMASLMIDGGRDFYGDGTNFGLQPCVELVGLSEAWIGERLNAFFEKSKIPNETREQIAASSDALRIAGATFGDLLKHLVRGGCVPLGLYRRQPQGPFASSSLTDSGNNTQPKSYVFTFPPMSTLLNSEDRVFIIPPPSNFR